MNPVVNNLHAAICGIGNVVQGDELVECRPIGDAITCLGNIHFFPVDIYNFELSIQASHDLADLAQSTPGDAAETRRQWRMALHLFSVAKAVSKANHDLGVKCSPNTCRRLFFTRTVEIEEWIKPGEIITADELFERCPEIPLGFNEVNLDNFTDENHPYLLTLIARTKSSQWDAFTLGTHHRLGTNSSIKLLYEDVLSLILGKLVE